uniref:Putative secreted protein n=1 Tax=Anopheles darlingi TaxID=43151 RepID=A0A2M4D6V3_ANODA
MVSAFPTFCVLLLCICKSDLNTCLPKRRYGILVLGSARFFYLKRINRSRRMLRNKWSNRHSLLSHSSLFAYPLCQAQ